MPMRDDSHGRQIVTPDVAPLSSELRIDGPEGELAGCLTLAPGSRSCVIIIPGSGPTDRDGNSPLGINAQTYKLLAQDLARRHISSLRIDKRGMFGSRLAINNPNAVCLEDYVDDVLRWSAVIREHYAAQKVWLIGHSEGALVAMAAAVRQLSLRNSPLCGLILMAAPGHPLGKIIKRQLRATPENADFTDIACAFIDQLEAGRHIPLKHIPAPLQGLFHPVLQDFLIDMFAVDPADLIAQIHLPALILQGNRDLQVDLSDAQRLRLHQPHAVLHMLQNANHVMKEVSSDDRLDNLSTYSNPDLPLIPELTDAIVEFISTNG